MQRTAVLLHRCGPCPAGSLPRALPAPLQRRPASATSRGARPHTFVCAAAAAVAELRLFSPSKVGRLLLWRYPKGGQVENGKQAVPS